ncbi:survival motor neuron protein [Homalodisca vitripennis]|uniref:survival motor neuron protein n=1 Tax=Homalodisca vitripennis TaxID=197043 RepID=UPI001EEAB8F5|nr:survival motor neuron protein [Homalodisca vitripennis]
MAKMKAEASSEEANLFIHKQEDSEDDDDVWDDAQLVKAYDRAIYKAKQQILDKIQKEMSLTEADIQDVLGDPPTPKKRKKRKNKSNTGGNYPMWKVGSACRAIWSEDGEEYECEIVEMIDGNWCTVRFIGYDNEEEVLLRELIPSFGKSVIEFQLASAKSYNAALKVTD